MDAPIPDAVLQLARALVASGIDITPSAPAPVQEASAYRVREVAADLKVDQSTVYRWIKTGALGSYRLQGSIRVPAAELAAFKRRSFIRPVGARPPRVAGAVA